MSDIDKIPVSLASDGTGVPVRTIRRWAKAGRMASEMRRGVLYVDPVDVTVIEDQRGSGGRLPRHAAGYESLASAIGLGSCPPG